MLGKMLKRFRKSRWLEAFLHRRSVRLQVGKVKIAVPLLEREKAKLAAEKVAEAIRRVQSVAPKHHLRIERFIPHVLVFGRPPYPAVYIRSRKMCNLLSEWVLLPETSADEVAALLVHEACHGYLDSLGIGYEEQERVRVERICFRNEIAFARKLPDGGRLSAGYGEWPEGEEEYWKDRSFSERSFDAYDSQVQELRELGAPRWIVAFLTRIGPARRAKFAAKSSGSAQP